MSAGGNQSESSNKSRSYLWGPSDRAQRQLFSQARWQSDRARRDGDHFLGGVQGGLNQGMMNAFQNMGVLGDAQGQIDAQSASLQAGLGQMFREEIMPGIQSNSIAMGGLGGGRQGVAEGVATGQMAQAFTQGLGDITANANQQSMMANSMMGDMAMQLGQVGTMRGNYGMDVLGQLAAILGGPTVLQRTKSSQESGGFNFGL